MKTIKIKDKDYVLVSERILYFNANYPNGSIINELISSSESPRAVVKSTITPDVKNPERKFTAYSQANINDGNLVNKTSALENAETSAVGRALGMMGIGVLKAVASADEMVKAGVRVTSTPETKEVLEASGDMKQLNRVCEKCGAPLKWSEKSQKYYCSALCWKNKDVLSELNF